jgi:hypothetical protein
MAAEMKKPGMFGKTEASTMRSRSVPITRKRLSTTALGSSTRPMALLHDA